MKTVKKKPCTNCPDEVVSGNLYPPLEYQWAALTNDGETIYQAAYTTEEKHIKDLDLKNIHRFVLQNERREDIFGIDVKKKSFMIMGVPIYTDLPDSEYEMFFMRKNRHLSDGGFARRYILGLKNGKAERYLYINPDNSFTMTNKYI